MLHDGQPRLRKEPLHHVLIHARRGAQHAGADIRDARKLEQALDGAVFAEGAVQHGKHNIERLAIEACLKIGLGRHWRSLRRRWLRRHQRWDSLMQEFRARRRLGVAGSQTPCDCRVIAFEQAVCIACGEPAALLGDADGHHIKFLAIDCFQNRSCREQ